MSDRKPIAKFNYKGLGVAVWANEKGCSYTIQKRYKPEGADDWKETKSLFREDVAMLSFLLHEALVAGEEYERQSRTDRKAAPQGQPAVVEAPADLFGDDDIPF